MSLKKIHDISLQGTLNEVPAGTVLNIAGTAVVGTGGLFAVVGTAMIHAGAIVTLGSATITAGTSTLINLTLGTSILPSINRHVDVVTTAPTNLQALIYGTSTGKYTPTSLRLDTHLADAIVSAPADNSLMRYGTSTGKWSNVTLLAGANVTITNGTSSITIASTGGGAGTSSGTSSTQMILASDTKASTTVGGTPTTGAWTASVLNTIDVDMTSACSVGSNLLNIPAGTYRFYVRRPFVQTSFSRVRLFDSTNSVVLGLGSNVWTSASGGGMADSIAQGRFTAASGIALRVDYWATSSPGNQGLGSPTSIASTNEIYTQLRLEKE